MVFDPHGYTLDEGGMKPIAATRDRGLDRASGKGFPALAARA